MRVGDRPIGYGAPCLVTAEIGQAHDGSLETAHAYVDAVAKTGCDAVKFQAHIASAESTAREPFRASSFRQDASSLDYWRRMEFSPKQWAGLRDHALDKGLVFLATPFSHEAIDMLSELDVPAWKVGSRDVATLSMIDQMASTGKPVLLSSGMSSWEELDEAVGTVKNRQVPFAMYQCPTSCPCAPRDVGLNVMVQMRDRYKCPVGLSDHSGTIFAGLAAKGLGADMLEVHVVFSRECFGPDVQASVTTGELAELVRGVRFLEAMSPVDKDKTSSAKSELRATFGRSIVAVRTLVTGHVLKREDLALKKPGGGLGDRDMEGIVGKQLLRVLKKDEPVLYSDLEPCN